MTYYIFPYNKASNTYDYIQSSRYTIELPNGYTIVIGYKEIDDVLTCEIQNSSQETIYTGINIIPGIDILTMGEFTYNTLIYYPDLDGGRFVYDNL